MGIEEKTIIDHLDEIIEMLDDWIPAILPALEEAQTARVSLLSGDTRKALKHIRRAADIEREKTGKSAVFSLVSEMIFEVDRLDDAIVIDLANLSRYTKNPRTYFVAFARHHDRLVDLAGVVATASIMMRSRIVYAMEGALLRLGR